MSKSFLSFKPFYNLTINHTSEWFVFYRFHSTEKIAVFARDLVATVSFHLDLLSVCISMHDWNLKGYFLQNSNKWTRDLKAVTTSAENNRLTFILPFESLF